MALELTKGQENARQKVIDKYEGAKDNLEALALDLRELYAIKDLENREYKLRILKEKYGGELDVYHTKQVAELNKSKKMLTSKYYVPSPNIGLGVQPLLYTNDPNASAEGIEMYSGRSLTVNETQLNLLYWPELDLNSEVNIQRREKEGTTLEDDIESLNKDEYTTYFNYGTAGNTDAWGRDYDHPDFGIDPSLINRTIVTPTPVVNNNDNNNNNNNNNEVIEEDTNEVINNNNTTNLGAEDGDLIAVNTDNNNNQEETPNRLELMTQSIKDNPSRIQQGLIESGFTPERLAKLKIKHQDWKTERRNRKNLQVEATT